MKSRLDIHLGAVELLVALVVLNAGLLALMSAFQSGSLGRADRTRASHTSPAAVGPVAPAPAGASITLRALEQTKR